MRTAQQGDRVRVHFVKRSQNGAEASSRGRAPLEMTVGTEHRRLPGLGLALVGRREGEHVQVHVPAEQAYGPPRAERVRRVARTRFLKGEALLAGSWVRVISRTGRRCRVRVVEVCDTLVVVDTNHPWVGQALELDVELVAIRAPGDGPDGHDSLPEMSAGG